MVKEKEEEQEPTPEPPVPEVEKTDTAELVKALESLAAEEAVDNRALNKLGEEIETLSPAAQKILIDSPLMQRLIDKASEGEGISGLKPGEVYKAGPISFKKPWRADDLEKFPKKSYSSARREEWTWNGIYFVFEEDEQYEIPEPIYQMIMTHKDDQKKARRELKQGFGMGIKQLSAEGWAGKQAEDAKGV